MSSKKSPGLCYVLRGLAALWLFAPRLGAVVISEIHYNPPEGGQLEFVELHNPAVTPLSLEGWAFTSGIFYTFPAGATIAGHGYVVLARNPPDFQERFQLWESSSIFGPYDAGLDNGGETLTLQDPEGRVSDEVEYDDDPPWDLNADGRGGSLERICLSGDALLPWNWDSDPVHGPSPLRAHPWRACPVPGPTPGPVVINEIHYHPANDADADQEFIELYNRSDVAADLTGYTFAQGLQFRFADGTTIAPRGSLVVCRNLTRARDALGIEGPAVGDFTGQLDNGGERITLFDSRGRIADSVRYRDAGEWPVGADGLGRSLERISPDAPGDDPASWAPSSEPGSDRWQFAAKTAIAPSSVLYIYLQGAGEFLLDDVVLEEASRPGVNLLANGSFDNGIEGWTATGNHLETTWTANGGTGDGGALRVVSNGRGASPANAISTTITPTLTLNTTQYRLSVRYRYLSGDRGLLLKLNGASTARGIFIDARNRPLVTPGRANSASLPRVPPLIGIPVRRPLEPRSTDNVQITARVRGNEVGGVFLDYWLNFKPALVDALEMFDDGLHGDGLPGDGLYAVELPPFPHNTAVAFRIRAEDASGGERVIPAAGDPSGYHGYYVNDDQPESPLPVLHILLNHLSTQTPLNLLRALNCDTWVAGAFAYRGDLYPSVGVRQRGGSVCGSQKPYLKLRFSHGRDFQGRHKINLQSLWTDKSLVREHLSWDLFGEMQAPYCTTRFVRLHANGKYFGLYSELEHPDANFLRRNGLNPNGNLYKAYASTEQLMPDYRAGYEKKTNENGDFSDLKTFLDTMNTIPRTQLGAFWEKNIVPDSVIDYQATQVLTNNADYPHKNHYLYHDTEDGRWRTITWDMDLTFGKYWDGSNGGVLNDRMDTPGLNPWYTTRVAGGGIGNYLLDRFFFDTPDRYYQRALRVRLWMALKEKYTPAAFDAKIFARRDLLQNEQAEDLKKWSRSAPTPNDPAAPRDFIPNLERVRAHIKSRQAFLLNYLQVTDRLPPPDRMKITEVMYRPSGDGQDLEFLEFYNNSGKEIDISGWTVEAVGYQFPPETKVAAEAVLVVARSPEKFTGRYGEEIRVFGPYPGELDDHGEELRLRDVGPGYPATIDAVIYRSDPPWPARSGDLGYSIELTEVTPERDNDYPQHWRASAFPGGSPGSIPGLIRGVPFRRGNCNGDERVSVSDAVFLLGMFNRDFTPPRCLDGCDANGDRAVDLSDVVVLLRYLFLGEEQIPFPGPRDCKPNPGSFCEEPNCQA